MQNQFFEIQNITTTVDDDHGHCVQLSVKEGDESAEIYLYTTTHNQAVSVATLLSYCTTKLGQTYVN